MMAPVRIAHLSDPHVVEPGHLLAGMVDTSGYFARAVAHVNAMDAPVDAVIITGDLTGGGLGAQYEHLVGLAAELTCPWYALIGNHDDADVARNHISDHLPSGGPRIGCGVINIGDVRVAALNSARPRTHSGSLDTDDLTWLAATLGTPHEGTTLVALHHPPVPVGLARMDEMRLNGGDAERFGGVVAGADVAAVLCGHIHRMTVTLVWSTVVISAASTAHAIAFDLSPDAPLACSYETPSVLVHTINEGLVNTHMSVIGEFPATVVEL